MATRARRIPARRVDASRPPSSAPKIARERATSAEVACSSATHNAHRTITLEGAARVPAPMSTSTFALAEPTHVLLDSSGTSYDAVVALGSDCGATAFCDDDTGGAGAARLSMDLAAGTYFVVLDAKTGAGGTWSLWAAFDTGPSEATVSFPEAADTAIPPSGHLWTTGDYVEGVRSTTLSSATEATISLTIHDNQLTCDVQTMESADQRPVGRRIRHRGGGDPRGSHLHLPRGERPNLHVSVRNRTDRIVGLRQRPGRPGWHGAVEALTGGRTLKREDKH